MLNKLPPLARAPARSRVALLALTAAAAFAATSAAPPIARMASQPGQPSPAPPSGGGVGSAQQAKAAAMSNVRKHPTKTAGDPAAFIEASLANAGARVVLFSQSWCPHSAAAKALLERNGVRFAAVELDEYTDANAVKAELARTTGAGSTPRVFVACKCVGGADALQQAEAAGCLDRVLAAPDFAAAQ